VNERWNILIPQRDGANLISGELAVIAPTHVRAMPSAFLCRCDQSGDKPFCNDAHVKVHFTDPAQLPAQCEFVAMGTGRLTIQPLPNGPNRCEGPLMIHRSDGRTASSSLTFLCRCGQFQKKPYCDGSHKRVGLRG